MSDTEQLTAPTSAEECEVPVAAHHDDEKPDTESTHTQENSLEGVNKEDAMHVAGLSRLSQMTLNTDVKDFSYVRSFIALTTFKKLFDKDKTSVPMIRFLWYLAVDADLDYVMFMVDPLLPWDKVLIRNRLMFDVDTFIEEYALGKRKEIVALKKMMASVVLDKGLHPAAPVFLKVDSHAYEKMTRTKKGKSEMIDFHLSVINEVFYTFVQRNYPLRSLPESVENLH